MLLLSENGRLVVRDGMLVTTTNAADCECCEAFCDCSAICATPWWRIYLYLTGYDDCDTLGGPCYYAATYEGTLTEYFSGSPEWPLDLPTGTSRYWMYTPADGELPCIDPTNPMIEFCCAEVLGATQQYVRLNYLEGGAWRAVGVDCPTYWNLIDVSEITNSGTEGCCGVPLLEVGCGTKPALACPPAKTGTENPVAASRAILSEISEAILDESSNAILDG